MAERPTPVQQDAYTYTAAASGGATVYLLTASATYQQSGTPETTTYSYGGYSGLQLQQVTPPTASDTIGAGAALNITSFDAFGRPATVTNALGMTTTYTYDDASGATTKTVQSGDG